MAESEEGSPVTPGEPLDVSQPKDWRTMSPAERMESLNELRASKEKGVGLKDAELRAIGYRREHTKQGVRFVQISATDVPQARPAIDEDLPGGEPPKAKAIQEGQEWRSLDEIIEEDRVQRQQQPPQKFTSKDYQAAEAARDAVSEIGKGRGVRSDPGEPIRVVGGGRGGGSERRRTLKIGKNSPEGGAPQIAKDPPASPERKVGK